MVYVDDYRAKFRGMMMSHMMADTEDELDAMGRMLGLKAEWKQASASGMFSSHYDLSESKRLKAIALGAKPVSPVELVKIMSGSGK